MKLAKLAAQARVGLALGQHQYVIAASQAILSHTPGHLQARCLIAQALLETGELSQAIYHFNQVLEMDPESEVAREGLAVALDRQGKLKGAIGQLELAYETHPANPSLRDALLSFRSQLDRGQKGLSLSPVATGRLLAQRGSYGKAIKLFDVALQSQPQRLDVRLARAECLWRCRRWGEAEDLCRQLLRENPRLLKPKVILALLLLQRGQKVVGVELLHQATVADPSGTVATPLLQGTPFQLPSFVGSWEVAEPSIPAPLEASVELVEETTLAPAPEVPPQDVVLWSSSDEPDTEIAQFQNILNRLSQGLEGRAKARVSGGIYLIVTSAANLTAKYGEGGFQRLHGKLERLCQVLGSQGYQPRLVYVDRREGLAGYQVSPAEAKAAEVADIMGRIYRWHQDQGEAVEHLLLVGNGDIIPFYHLPNPTEDEDPHILSDAPYAPGEHIFAPRNSVGRLPDGASSDPSYLLLLLDLLMGQYSGVGNGKGWWPGVVKAIRPAYPRTLGYVALVWRPASEAFLEQVSGNKFLRTCPPTTQRSWEATWMEGRQFQLYNLHGTLNSPHWYGQKDSSYPADYPLFPVALTPQLLAQADLSGAIVFTEACYGTHIVGKSADASLALEFLRRGAAVVVGFTTTSYGSSEPPLGGADLLAQFFWRSLVSGLTAGEALARSKEEFVAVMNQRQGYLDGDDQKMVLQGILLGNPAACLAPLPSENGREAMAYDTKSMAAPPCPPLFCKFKAKAAANSSPPEDILPPVWRHLRRKAPEMAEGHLEVRPRALCHSEGRGSCSGDCSHPMAQQGGAYLVTSRKAIALSEKDSLMRIARVTVDDQGNILKTVVSK